MTTVLDSLNKGLHEAFAADPAVMLIGEDLLDPYGGAFKVTRGLSTQFQDRVWAAPISEAGMVGVAAGMALRGMRPVVEIMFGDFLTLAADQIINHISKYHWMYNEQTHVPIVIRTPMGGRRGYGPTHSQTLEKLFLGVPGLSVIAPSALGNPGALLKSAILDEKTPTLFIENKLLYLAQVHDSVSLMEFEWSTSSAPPVYRLRIKGGPAPDFTLIAYGYMAELALQAAQKLAYDHEVFAEVVVPARISPPDMEVMLYSIQHTRRLLTVEEGTLTQGWGAEIVSRAVESTQGQKLRAGRVAALDLPVPASGALENLVLPDVEKIVAAALHLVKD